MKCYGAMVLLVLLLLIEVKGILVADFLIDNKGDYECYYCCCYCCKIGLSCSEEEVFLSYEYYYYCYCYLDWYYLSCFDPAGSLLFVKELLLLGKSDFLMENGSSWFNAIAGNRFTNDLRCYARIFRCSSYSFALSSSRWTYNRNSFSSISAWLPWKCIDCLRLFGRPFKLRWVSGFLWNLICYAEAAFTDFTKTSSETQEFSKVSEISFSSFSSCRLEGEEVQQD